MRKYILKDCLRGPRGYGYQLVVDISWRNPFHSIVGPKTFLHKTICYIGVDTVFYDFTSSRRASAGMEITLSTLLGRWKYEQLLSEE